MRVHRWIPLLAILLILAGCAARPVGAPGTPAEPSETTAESSGGATAGEAVNPTDTAPDDPLDEPVETAPGDAASLGQVSLLFVGDIMLTRIPGDHVAMGEDPFAGVADLLTGADLTIGNLECVIATVGEKVPKAYNFRCHPQNVPLLARYFDAVSVANNHSGDYGKEAFAEQLRLLKEGGVPYFGGGMNLAEAHSPLILERNGLKIALLGYNEIELRTYEAGAESPGLAWSVDEQVTQDIKEAREKADLVVVYPHWGLEYHSAQSERQQYLARQMLAAGADLVVGSHPHVTQPVAVEEGHLIAFSLGNFVFDDFMDVSADLNEPARTSWMLRVTLNKQGLVDWQTFVARTDDRGFPQRLTGVGSPCSEGRADQGFICQPQ